MLISLRRDYCLRRERIDYYNQMSQSNTVVVGNISSRKKCGKVGGIACGHTNRDLQQNILDSHSRKIF